MLLSPTFVWKSNTPCVNIFTENVASCLHVNQYNDLLKNPQNSIWFDNDSFRDI